MRSIVQQLLVPHSNKARRILRSPLLVILTFDKCRVRTPLFFGQCRKFFSSQLRLETSQKPIFLKSNQEIPSSPRSSTYMRNSFNIPFRPSYCTVPYAFINVNHFGIHDKMLRVYSREVRGGAKRKLDISNASPPSIISHHQNGLSGQTLCRPKKGTLMEECNANNSYRRILLRYLALRGCIQA